MRLRHSFAWLPLARRRQQMVIYGMTCSRGPRMHLIHLKDVPKLVRQNGARCLGCCIACEGWCPYSPEGLHKSNAMTALMCQEMRDTWFMDNKT